MQGIDRVLEPRSMSEYQYYEFHVIDKPLTQRQMSELRKLSTRAEITPTSFTNEYQWGDFRGNPRAMMATYFDAFLYYANWGTHWFMLRLPAKLVDVKTMKQYCGSDSVSLRTKGGHVILEFHSEDESGDWDEEGDSNWLASLIPLRADLLGGDVRSLYLGWLAALQAGEIDDDEVEPPLPPSMKHLSASLQSLADFLRIDAKLLKAAAALDESKPQAAPSQTDLSRWIKLLPPPKKDKILLQLIKNDSPHLRETLLQQFRQSQVKTVGTKTDKKSVAVRRTAGAC